MEDKKHWAPYGWLHSCGELYYQLDHPVDCQCSEEGEWEWYEESDENE